MWKRKVFILNPKTNAFRLIDKLDQQNLIKENNIFRNST